MMSWVAPVDLWVTAIARRAGRDPKTVRKYIERGIEVPPMARPQPAGQASWPI